MRRFSGRPLVPEPSRSINLQENRQLSYLEPTSQTDFRISEVFPTDTATSVQRELPVRQEQAEQSPTSSYRPQSPRRVQPRKRSLSKCCLFRPTSNRNVARPRGKRKYQDDATQTSRMPADVPSRRDYFLEVDDMEPQGQSSSISAQDDRRPFLKPASSRKFRISVASPTATATSVHRELPVRQEQAELSPKSSYKSQPSRTIRPRRDKCDTSCPGSNRRVPRSPGRIKYQDDTTQTSHMLADVPSRREYFLEVEDLEPQVQVSSISDQEVRRPCYLQPASLRECHICEASPTATATPVRREFPVRQEQAEPSPTSSYGSQLSRTVQPSPTSSYTSQTSSTVRRRRTGRKCCLLPPTSNRRVPKSAGKVKYQDDATQTSHISADIPSRKDYILEVENLEPKGQLSSIRAQVPCYLEPASLRKFQISEVSPQATATPVQREVPVRQEQSELSPKHSYRPQPSRTVQPTRSRSECNPSCPGSKRRVPTSPGKIKYQDDRQPSYIPPTSSKEFRIPEASPAAAATSLQRELPVIQEQAELSPTSSYRPQPSRTVRPRRVPRSSGRKKYQDDATQTSHTFAEVPSRRNYIVEMENLEPQGQLSSISVQIDRRSLYLEPASLREFRTSETSPTATATPVQRELSVIQPQAEGRAASSSRPQPSRSVRPRRNRSKYCLFRPASNRRVPRSPGKIKYQDDATQTSHTFAGVPSKRGYLLEAEDLEQEGQLSSLNYETVDSRVLPTATSMYDQSPVTIVPPRQISRTSMPGLERSSSISEPSIGPPRKRKIVFKQPSSDTSGEPQISFIMPPKGSRISRGTQTHYRRDASVQTSLLFTPSARSAMKPTQKTNTLPKIMEHRRSEMGPADFLYKTISAEVKITEYAPTEKKGDSVASRPPKEYYSPSPIWTPPSDKEDQATPDIDEELVEYHPPRVRRQRRRREAWVQPRSMKTYCLNGWVLFKIVELILLILCFVAAILFFDAYQVTAVKVRSVTNAIIILKWSALSLAITVTIVLLVYGYYKRRPSWCNLAAVAGTGFLIFAFAGTYLVVVHHGVVNAMFSNITTFILAGVYLADMYYSLVMRGIEKNEIKGDLTSGGGVEHPFPKHDIIQALRV